MRCRGVRRCARRPQSRWRCTKATSGRPPLGVRQISLARADSPRPGSARNLLVWTTTPWTLSATSPPPSTRSSTYLKVKHKDEIYYVAKGAFTAQRLEEQFKRKEWVEGVPKLKTLEQIFKEKGGFEIVGELPGKELVGWTYDGPFDELPAQNHPGGYPAGDRRSRAPSNELGAGQVGHATIHRVIAWDQVGETEGTGIVHIAPGCGKEDFLLGKEQRLAPIAPLDDLACFCPASASSPASRPSIPRPPTGFSTNLQKKGRLLAVEKYPHNYPHCWRCKTELLFRLVDEWFIDMKWRDEIMDVVEKVTFLPESINGKARELDWLKNMGDWMISKKRYWGLALPIWVDARLRRFRRHRRPRRTEGAGRRRLGQVRRAIRRIGPWIDLVKIKCAE